MQHASILLSLNVNMLITKQNVLLILKEKNQTKILCRKAHAREHPWSFRARLYLRRIKLNREIAFGVIRRHTAKEPEWTLVLWCWPDVRSAVGYCHISFNMSSACGLLRWHSCSTVQAGTEPLNITQDLLTWLPSCRTTTSWRAILRD